MVCECPPGLSNTSEHVADKPHSADAWSRWENSTSKLMVDPAYIARSDDPKWLVSLIPLHQMAFRL